MKYLSILIFIVLISCEKKYAKAEKTENRSITSKSLDSKKRRIPFFEFDEIIYYHISDSLENDWTRILHKHNRTVEETRFMNIFIGHYPESITDKDFLNNLKKFYPHKKEIKQTEFAVIKDIYSEKFYGDYSIAGCVPYYRDILIFKKKKAIVGISKICFQCYLHETIGTKQNTEQLGQNGDYEKLQTILTRL